MLRRITVGIGEGPTYRLPDKNVASIEPLFMALPAQEGFYLNSKSIGHLPVGRAIVSIADSIRRVKLS